MNKYLSQLRPMERRLVVGVAVVVLVVLNYVFIWPHFSDWGNYRHRLEGATLKLKNYRDAVARISSLKERIAVYENQGEFVPPEDQGISFMRTIQSQATQSGVQLQSSGRTGTSTTDPYFIEQTETINALATEASLVDFLYKLGSGSSMIRVRDLALQPDPPHQRLLADIRLVASYQKNPAASAAKNATAKAK